MINLIKNELMKLFSRKLTKILLVILCIFAIGGSIATNSYKAQTEDWRIVAQKTIEVNENRIELMNLSPQLKADAENKVAISKYRLENNLPAPKATVTSAMLNISGLVEMVIIMVLLSAAEIVSREYSDGTMKLLLIRPHSRLKILISKYLTIIIFGIIALLLTIITSGITNMFIYGFGNISSVDLFINQSGEIVQLSTLTQMLKMYGFSIFPILSYATIAFAISTIIKNSALAVGISLVTMILGNSMIEATSKIAWLKYLPFANSDMSLYIYHLQPRPEMSIFFSIGILLIYIVSFLYISLFVFNKRDVSI
ncbi:ABC transporter permease [Aerococcus urinae]|uniref:ABC transporter permease n=1 Tax=Aerococcus urinae TaxID=1376 RepID=UPI0018E1197B|nr:ABC transporter permease subunit [Aerococcus urinae]